MKNLNSRHSYLVAGMLAVLATGCPSQGGKVVIDARVSEPGAYDSGADGTPGGAVFRSCLTSPLPADLPTVGWNHTTNEIITLATPWHSAQDVLATPDTPLVLEGKFSYGSISKDLEDERIEVWLDDCAGGYTRLGEQNTNSDGRILLSVAAADVPDIGEYRVYFRVMGDNSATFATLRVYPPKTQFIVFDIDATLTTSDSELVGQVVSDILDQNVVPEARVDAQAVTDLRHRTQGYELIYLTGRPYLLTELTRRWLVDLGFPGGTVRLTDSVAASWPSDGAVGQYKAEFLLSSVIGQGFTIYAAYGNATSDIYAYGVAGVPKERTYILGTHGGEEQTVALGEAYTEHIAQVQGEPPASQPFRR